MATRICETVAVPTLAGLRAARDASRADLVELRLDALREPIDVDAALEGRRKPVIVTCRPTWEGGAFAGSEEERRRILVRAFAAGAEWVDVEWKAGFDVPLPGAVERTVRSLHDFDGIPRDLTEVARQMRATGAGVVKIAVTPRRLADLVDLKAAGSVLGDQPRVLIGMGEFGVASRVLASHFGSCWTYAGHGAAPGQLPVARMIDDFGVRRVSAGTPIYGIVGRPVTWSLSPTMHNAAFRASGKDAIYVPLPSTSADDFVAFARTFPVAGASVTAPLKVDVLAVVDELDDVCRRTGAANTIKCDGGRWTATNTDVAGFLAPLEARLALEGARAAVLGAGGAARAVVLGLTSAGARVQLCARREPQARAVAAATGAEVGPWPPTPGSWDLLVNTTPVGSAPAVDEMPFAGPFTGRLVYDLIYQPVQTRLLREAERAGCATLGGLDMLVAQAQAQAEWWIGVRPSESLLRGAAMSRLAQQHIEAAAL